MPTLETMKTPPNAGTPCLKGAGNYDDPDCPEATATGRGRRRPGRCSGSSWTKTPAWQPHGRCGRCTAWSNWWQGAGDGTRASPGCARTRSGRAPSTTGPPSRQRSGRSWSVAPVRRPGVHGAPPARPGGHHTGQLRTVPHPPGHPGGRAGLPAHPGGEELGAEEGPADKGPAGPSGQGRWDRPLLVPAGQDLPHGDRQEGRPGEHQPGLPGRCSGVRPQEMRRVRSVDCRPVAEGECVTAQDRDCVDRKRDVSLLKWWVERMDPDKPRDTGAGPWC